MKNDTVNIGIPECLKNERITFKITGVKKFTARLKIAMFFIRIAAWTMPINTDVEIES
jgi:hypothetical protein